MVQEQSVRLSELKTGFVRTVKKMMVQASAYAGSKARLLAVVLLPLAVCLSGCASKTVLEDTMLPKEQPREEVQQILDHYPAGSIGSVAKADEILEIVGQEKKNIDARLYNEKLVCNDKFLVYACYEEAEARKRTDLRAITMLEVEAKRYKRADEVRQSDLQRDINEMDEIADAPDRYDSIKSHEAKLKRIQEKEQKREQAARGITDTPKEKHKGNLMTPKENGKHKIKPTESTLKNGSSHANTDNSQRPSESIPGCFIATLIDIAIIKLVRGTAINGLKIIYGIIARLLQVIPKIPR